MSKQSKGMLYGENIQKLTYAGPTKFKGRCEKCGEARNRHCGRCRACPGYHVATCLTGYASGAWH